MLLGELLKARGIKFDVLSRGYGRRSRGVLAGRSSGLRRMSSAMSRCSLRGKLQVPVIVGEDRYRGGAVRRIEIWSATSSARRRFSASRPGSRFRHRAGDAAGCERPPAARGSAARAAAIFAARGCCCARKWRFRRFFSRQGQAGLASAARHQLPRGADAVPPRPVVFCGIARPQNFVLQLRAANIEPVAEAFYRDHHAYSEKDIRELLVLKQRSEGGGFVTTEKDAVNLGAYLSALEPLALCPCTWSWPTRLTLVDTMLREIEERKRRRMRKSLIVALPSSVAVAE